ncbi:hypothetical protein BGX30_008957 [Mortierella sp. GBA39]|nr:hypothetical protein BGX30_008957 [Mortierella sp. GBA39]
MKLSVFTVVTPDLTPEELVLAAKEAGLDGVEWRFKEVPAGAASEKPSFWSNNLCSIDPSLPAEQMQKFKDLALSQGLEVVSITPYLNHLDLKDTEHVFRTAQQLGAKMIRLGVAGYNGTADYNELYDKTLRYLKEAEQMAKQYGVKGIIETHHGTIAPSAGLAHRLLLGPYLAHVHIKNAEWVREGTREDGTVKWRSKWAPMREGIVDFTSLLNDLKSVGYDGYLGIEDFSEQYTSRELLKEFAQLMRERM